jgi:Flp pilus assembly protein TadB
MMDFLTRAEAGLIVAVILGFGLLALFWATRLALRAFLETSSSVEAENLRTTLRFTLGERLGTASFGASVIATLLYVGLAVGFVTGGIQATIIAIAVVGFVVLRVGQFGTSRRMRQLEQTLPEALQQISNELASTGSIETALNNVIDTTQPPARDELKLLQSRIAFLGVPGALDRTAKRLDSHSFSLMSAVLRVGTQQGGNLQGALRDLSVTLIELERLRRKVEAASAGSRRAMLAMYLVSPIMPIFTFTTLGDGAQSLQDPMTQRLLAVAALLWVLAGWLYLRMVRIRV